MTAPSKRPFKIKRLGRLAEKIYPPEFISELAKEFKITNQADVIQLKKVLRLAGRVYLDQKRDESLEPKVRDLTAELATIKKHAIELKNELNYLSNPVEELLWLPLRHVPSELLINPEVSEYFGYPIVRHTFDYNTQSIKFPDEYRIKDALNLISNLADHVIKRIVPDKGGRPSSEALRIWVINMQRLWVKELGRPFTYYQHRGIPVSAAFMFCQKALRPLDKSISTALLGTTVRSVIKETPKALRVRKRRKVP